MKAKLYKVDNGYVLLVDNIMYATDNDKLSKQNCDEIFEVVDVDKLGQKHYEVHIKRGHTQEESLQRKIDFIVGFNKAMELNKDKVFTLEDMRTAMLNAIEMTDFQKEQFRKDNDYHIALDIIQSLQQPTEIEVMIEMEDLMTFASMPKEGENRVYEQPKLDSSGCLVLKRV